MVLQQLFAGKITNALGVLGPLCVGGGTVFTATSKTLIREIQMHLKFQGGTAVVLNGELYLLKTGEVDLTSVATDLVCTRRADDEAKTINPMTNSTVVVGLAGGTGIVAANFITFSRNTIMNTGDSIRIWYHYAAVTPAPVSAYVTLMGIDGLA